MIKDRIIAGSLAGIALYLGTHLVGAAAEGTPPAVPSPVERPSWRQMAGGKVEGIVERNGVGHDREGVLGRWHLPLTRTVLAEGSGGWETHRVRESVDAVMTVRRLNFGARVRFSEYWGAMGSMRSTTAGEDGTASSASRTHGGILLASRRYSERLTLTAGVLWSERLAGADRWIGFPGLIWQALPNLTIRTHQGITADWRLNEHDTIGFEAAYRGQEYRLREREELIDPILHLSGVPLRVAFRRRSDSGFWVHMASGVDARPLETLKDSGNCQAWRTAPAPTWSMHISSGWSF